jgi:hypothetical protein
MNPYSGRNAPLLKNVRGGRAPVSTRGFPVVGNGLGGLPRRAIARGGQIIDYIENGVRYRAHIFTSSGFFVANRAVDVEYLGVGGGGGGGRQQAGTRSSGGGGAGGLLTNVGGTKLPLAAGAYLIVIGAGGAGGSSSGFNGANSSGLALTAIGGGFSGSGTADGGNGGSGGGGGRGSSAGGSGVSGQGFAGGDGSPSTVAAGRSGAGGGATGVGENGVNSSATPAVGGAGLLSTITGQSVTYATGGNATLPGEGVTTPGAINTGNGGFGNSIEGDSFGNPGGSGFYVVRYLR